MRILRSEVCQVSKGGNFVIWKAYCHFFFIINSVCTSDFKVRYYLGLLIQVFIIIVDVLHDSDTWWQQKVSIVARQPPKWCASGLSVPHV